MSLEMKNQQAKVQHNGTADVVHNCNDASSDDDDYDSVPQKYLNVRLLVLTRLILSSLTTYSLFPNKP